MIAETVDGHQRRASLIHHLQTAAPLFPIAVGLILGVVIDSRLAPDPLVWLGGLSGLTLATLFVTRRSCILFVVLAACAVTAGGTLNGFVVRTLPADSIAHHAREWGQLARVRGIVVTPPSLRMPGEDRLGPMWRWMHAETQTVFLLRAEQIQGPSGWRPASGKARVTLSSPVLDLKEGERIELLGELFSLVPARQRNPGMMDWDAYLRRQGVCAKLVVEDRRNLLRIDQAGLDWWSGLVHRVRILSAAYLTSDLDTAPEEVSFLAALVLGRQSQFDRRLNEIFSKSGCMHFVAVSGTNVAMIMGFVWLVCRLFRLSRHRSAGILLISVLLYAMSTEPRAPILRATVLGVLLCIALRLRRTPSTLNWTSAAAIVLVVIDPQTVFDAGFQLSFVAVLAVAYLAPAILLAVHEAASWSARRNRSTQELTVRNLPVEPSAMLMQRWANRIYRTLLAALVVSVAAWMATLPLIAAYFNQTQVWAPVSTLILFPLVTLVMVLGGVKIVASFLLPSAGAWIGALITRIDAVLLSLVDRISRLPGTDWICCTPPWWLMAAYFSFLMLLILRFYRPQFGTSKLPATWDRFQSRTPWIRSNRALVAHAMVVLAFWAYWQHQQGPRGRMVVTVFSVGSGLASLIELPNGEFVLYDAGTSGAYDAGRFTIAPYLRQRGSRRIAHAFVSHPDLDHFNGIPGLMQVVEIGQLHLSPSFARGEHRRAAGFFVEWVKERERSRGHAAATRSRQAVAGGAFTETGQSCDSEDAVLLEPGMRRWSIAGADFEFLWPPAQCPENLSDNDASLVLRVAYAGHSVLLTGDIEEATQRQLMERVDLHADVLVLPHHGSVCKTTEAFLDAVNAEILIRSSGQAMQDTSNGLANLIGKRTLLNTADVGAVQAVFDDSGVSVSAFGQSINHRIAAESGQTRTP